MDWVVIGVGVILTGLLGWYFFGPKRAGRVELQDGVQVVRVTLNGGYSPDLIDGVRPGVPVRVLFDRQESGDCTSRVVMPDFKVNAALPAYRTTAVEFVAPQAGEYRFTCGMNMVSGTIRVSGPPLRETPVRRDRAVDVGAQSPTALAPG